MRFAYKIKIVGRENIPLDRGIILASNHRSNADPVFIGIGCKRTVRFMAKEELFKNKFFSYLITHLGAFPVKRGVDSGSAINYAEKIVSDGGVLGIFPEGTRHKDGVLGRAKSGTIVIAKQTGGDIVPVSIDYQDKFIWRRKIVVTYGKPIQNSDFHLDTNSKESLKSASKLIMSRIAENLTPIKPSI
ncbi:MAG: lysophospholipid acyltransferase family protein [Oscillospiraceae bacterium]